MNKFIFFAFSLLAAIYNFGIALPTVPTDSTESPVVPLPSTHNDQIVEATSSAAETESSAVEAQAQQAVLPLASVAAEKPSSSIHFDMSRSAGKVAFKVYGQLAADKQPKKLADIRAAAKNAPPLPPPDYDVERVADKAADNVYGLLPVELQPKRMTEEERAEYTPELFKDFEF